MVNRWREKLRQFMIGRYGMDQLNQYLMYGVLILLGLNIFLDSFLLRAWAIIGIVYMYFRMLSRNINRRFQENQAFQGLLFRAGQLFKRFRFDAGEARKYKIFRCPGCGQKVRIPRGHGKVSIHCPKCGRDFIKRS